MNDDEKKQILEEVLNEYYEYKANSGYMQPTIKEHKKLFLMLMSIAFAKGEEFERKSFEDKIMYTTEDGWDWTVKRGKKAIQNMERNVARADKRVKELETELKQSEQRGYEKGYDEGYTDGINNGTYQLKKPTAKKEAKP